MNDLKIIEQGCILGIENPTHTIALTNKNCGSLLYAVWGKKSNCNHNLICDKITLICIFKIKMVTQQQ